jgi:hypothetical protein
MRRRAFMGLVLAGPTVALIGLPTVTAAWARPRPIAPTITRLPLRGVDGSARGALRAPGPAPLLLNAPTDTAEFSLVGVTWDPDADVRLDIQVRTRRGGRWSPWTPLPQQDEHRPDGPEATAIGLRHGTAPLWVGPSDGVQVSVANTGGGRPRGVRVELVDPGSSPADSPRALPKASAHASESRPPIVTRAQWGADESIRKGSPSYTSTVKVGFVHHTASSNDYTPEQAAAMVRGIYAYHVKSNGWSDIGYNFLVDRYGRAYEGRAGGIERFVLGAHTGGFNVNSFGVGLLGNFTSVPPSSTTLGVLAQVLAWKLGSAYRDPSGKAVLTSAGGGTSKYTSGSKVTFDVVSGHRDAGNTSCPGGNTYSRLPTLREDVTTLLGAGFADPAVTGGTKHELGSRGPVEVRAHTLGQLAWTGTVTDEAGTVLRRSEGSGGEAVLSWDLTDAEGAPVRPGTYEMRLTGSDGADPALPFTATVIVANPACRGGALARALCRARLRAARR